MIFELGKRGFKSGEWETVEDFILQHRIVIKMVIDASFCNNIFFSKCSGF